MGFWINPTTTTVARAKAINLEHMGLSVKIPNALNSKSLILRGIFANDFLHEYSRLFAYSNFHIIGVIDVAFFEVPKFTNKIQQFSMKEVEYNIKERSLGLYIRYFRYLYLVVYITQNLYTISHHII